MTLDISNLARHVEGATAVGLQVGEVSLRLSGDTPGDRVTSDAA